MQTEEDDEDDGPDEPGKRKYVTLDALTISRLKKLAKGGWYGGKRVPQVMKTMIETAVREARDKGYLSEGD